MRLERREAADLRRTRAGREYRVQAVNVEADVGRPVADDAQDLLDHRIGALRTNDQISHLLIAKREGKLRFGNTLGRPLGLGDRAAVDRITAETRENGDGLATMIRAIATSELFLGR